VCVCMYSHPPKSPGAVPGAGVSRKCVRGAVAFTEKFKSSQVTHHRLGRLDATDGPGPTRRARSGSPPQLIRQSTPDDVRTTRHASMHATLRRGEPGRNHNRGENRTPHAAPARPSRMPSRHTPRPRRQQGHKVTHQIQTNQNAPPYIVRIPYTDGTVLDLADTRLITLLCA
jgi:hypothetical protein